MTLSSCWHLWNLCRSCICGDPDRIERSLGFDIWSTQNLLYEKRHYENEIRACLSYHSAFSDADIELMPVDDFTREVLCTLPECWPHFRTLRFCWHTLHMSLRRSHIDM